MIIENISHITVYGSHSLSLHTNIKDIYKVIVLFMFFLLLFDFIRFVFHGMVGSISECIY